MPYFYPEAGNAPDSSEWSTHPKSQQQPGRDAMDELDPRGGADATQVQRGREQNGASHTPAAGKRGRGFASMDPRRVSEIASLGGKAAHAQGVAHEWTAEEARQAGRKGGQSSRGSRSGSLGNQ